VVVFCCGRTKEIASRLRERGEAVDEVQLARELTAWEQVIQKTLPLLEHASQTCPEQPRSAVRAPCATTVTQT
jgi:hypothetical protein